MYKLGKQKREFKLTDKIIVAGLLCVGVLIALLAFITFGFEELVERTMDKDSGISYSVAGSASESLYVAQNGIISLGKTGISEVADIQPAAGYKILEKEQL